MSNSPDLKNVVDFVLPWVDGNDPEWLEQFKYYSAELDGDNRKCRFRDWDNLKYIFRAFEQYTPWVRKIHFVTWGHLPSWLNTDHKKLHIVQHKDYLCSENLPVFSSHPIELNFHRIPDLTEKFVYFNDDMFLLRPIDESYFFKDGMPCDAMAFNTIYDSPIAHIKINNLKIINDNFNKREVVKSNFFKIFNFNLDLAEILKTILLLPWPKMTGFYDPHQPQPFLRSTFEEVWKRIPSVLHKTSSKKIRSSDDVNQYLFRYWQLCQGKFSTRSFCKTFSKMIETKMDVDEFCHKIVSGQYEMICINDNIADEYLFIDAKKSIARAFDEILPNKSSFEK